MVMTLDVDGDVLTVVMVMTDVRVMGLVIVVELLV